MQEREVHIAIRNEARAFEEALPPDQRKELGQFFTGMRLGRVLAHLSIDDKTTSILDPMAGSGDLLDAAREAAIAYGADLQRLDGIEVDEATAAMCEKRLRGLHDQQVTVPHVVSGDAFNPDTLDSIPLGGYDLVITNPPYVRYQSLNGRGDQVRRDLLATVDQRLSGSVKEVWRALSVGYSGLADLSIPAWLLSALLVRPGGRLALVVPATWRSRAYADVIRYLLLRCFELELVVEDTQPGWFSDALVRTHLVVARRILEDRAAEQLSARASWPHALWVQVAPDAASSESLVGNVFPDYCSEAAFAEWCRDPERPDVPGISFRAFPLENEWWALRSQAAGRSWMKALEQSVLDLPLFAKSSDAAASVPETLRDVLPESFDGQALRSLDEANIRTGQGLRTGCNRFFYVKLVERNEDGASRVETDPALGGRRLTLPSTALQPVLHRQADLNAWRNGLLPATRVLDLRSMVLPEDLDALSGAVAREFLQETRLPAVMPEELAAHVREAGKTPLGSGERAQPVAALSAVKTNARPARGGALPRFWYMLPDFRPRHMPQAFVPRIIHETPQVYANTEPAVLIDANFSTFWAERESWTPAGLAAFLNSSWCRAVMEAAGTPLGGGALKLEAAHLRKMPVPHLEPEAVTKLNDAGTSAQDGASRRLIDRIVLRALLSGDLDDAEIDTFAERLNERRAALGVARQKGAA